MDGSRSYSSVWGGLAVDRCCEMSRPTGEQREWGLTRPSPCAAMADMCNLFGAVSSIRELLSILSTTVPVVSLNRGERSACPICAANGKEPNHRSLLAIEQVDRGEVCEYTGTVGQGMIDRILEGEFVRKKSIRSGR